MNLKEQRELAKLRRGEIQAFESLFHRHYPGMVGYATGLVRSREVAEEAVQEVFYNIWKNRAELRISRSLQSYLYRASYNHCMMALRKLNRETELDSQRLDPASESGDPLSELEFRETSGRIESTLSAMPERTRIIFLMNRQDGLKYREIAEKMGISVKTVEAHMGKALKILKHEMEKG